MLLHVTFCSASTAQTTTKHPLLQALLQRTLRIKV
jgi:hypothetical protein